MDDRKTPVTWTAGRCTAECSRRCPASYTHTHTYVLLTTIFHMNPGQVIARSPRVDHLRTDQKYSYPRWQHLTMSSSDVLSVYSIDLHQATYRHWSVSLWRDPDDVPHCRILNGGLSRLHSVNEDAVSWLTSYSSWHAYEKKKCKMSAQVVSSHLVWPNNPANGFRPPSATVVSAEPFLHGTGTLQCLQKEMATYGHWSVSLWRDSDDVSYCRILSPNKTEWRLISATLCG